MSVPSGHVGFIVESLAALWFSAPFHSLHYFMQVKEQMAPREALSQHTHTHTQTREGQMYDFLLDGMRKCVHECACHCLSNKIVDLRVTLK